MSGGGRASSGQILVLSWLVVVPSLSQVRHSLPVLWIMPLTDNPGRGNLTASVLPAVQLALDDLSRQQTPLRNYEIHFHVIDSEVTFVGVLVDWCFLDQQASVSGVYIVYVENKVKSSVFECKKGHVSCSVHLES